MGAFAPKGSGARSRGFCGSPAFVASLALNAFLVALLLTGGPPALPGTPAHLHRAAGRNASSVAELGDSFGPLMEDMRQEMLSRAEASYQRNVRRKVRLVATAEELAVPFPAAVIQALARVHPFLTEERYLNVFRKEYMLLPRYPCFEEERVGTWGEGGKWICKAPLHKDPKDIVVYSIGSCGDASFEDDMFALLGARSFTFDPFLESWFQEQVAAREHVQFFNYGLAPREPGVLRQGDGGRVGQGKDIGTIMRELGHTFIDVFKIDCEGCEGEFVAALHERATRAQPLFGQILMETHNANNLTMESQIFRSLNLLGYRMFHMEPNLFDPGVVFEVAFIHESLVLPRTTSS